ncbi:MAG: hypothetical protein ACJ74O_02595 [Frankiaceae bacterium]
MPRQNRVTPYGEIVATPERGTFLGNRGILHDDAGNVVRHARNRAWIICVLSVEGRRRQIMRPGTWTELFFLDEATAMAAGHRPCAECRHRDYVAFRALWRSAHGEPGAMAADIDAALARQRPRPPDLRPRPPDLRPRRTVDAASLPDGVMVEWQQRPWLLHGGRLLAWAPGGYERAAALPAEPVAVVTPEGTVRVLAAGYRPVLHPSAERQ